MGVDAEWTYDGKIADVLPFPEPFKKRPRLGARHIVKCELPKLFHPIKREIKDKIHL